MLSNLIFGSLIIKLSFLEVYNEILIDLISDSKEYLDIMEDPEKGTVVSNLT